MQALVKKHAEKGLWLEEVPLPEVGINDVLIKVKRTAICGTDLHIYNLSLIHISEPTRPPVASRMPSSA